MKIAVELLKPYINYFFNSADEESAYPKKSDNWEDVYSFVPGSAIVGVDSKDERFYWFQIRELTEDTRNYTCGYPEKEGKVGDVIIEVCFAPHQMWGYYNMSNKDDITELKKVLDIQK